MADIDEYTLMQIVEGLDKDKDGIITKDEFKVPFLKLFPKITDKEYDEKWKEIDSDGNGELSVEEIGKYYGFNLGKGGKANSDEMTDEQILEALQMEAALAELQMEASKTRSSPSKNSKAKASEDDGKKRKNSSDKERKSSLGIECVKMPASGRVSYSIDDPRIQFIQACELGDKQEIMSFISPTSPLKNLRLEDDKGEFPLHKLARQGLTDLVRSYLEHMQTVQQQSIKVDLNWQDKQGKSPIFYAVEYGHLGLVQLFLDRGTDPMTETNNGWTILHTAVNAANDKAAEKILEHPRVSKEKLVSVSDKSKRQPIHIAAFKGSESMIQLLLKHGADPAAKDASGNSAMVLAGKGGRRKSKELLQEHVDQRKSSTTVDDDKLKALQDQYSGILGKGS